MPQSFRTGHHPRKPDPEGAVGRGTGLYIGVNSLLSPSPTSLCSTSGSASPVSLLIVEPGTIVFPFLLLFSHLLKRSSLLVCVAGLNSTGQELCKSIDSQRVIASRPSLLKWAVRSLNHLIIPWRLFLSAQKQSSLLKTTVTNDTAC